MIEKILRFKIQDFHLRQKFKKSTKTSLILQK